jgi:hypothetical protein
MAPIEKRVSGLEARMDEHKDQIVNLREEVRGFRAETRAEFAAVRAETRAEFAAVRSEIHDQFTVIRSEMALRTETAASRASMERGFERLDQKIDTHFRWLVGIMVTGFLTGFGTMITLFLRVLDRLP